MVRLLRCNCLAHATNERAERQKATRKLKKLQREIAAHEGAEAPETLRAQARDIEIEVNYTLHYPPGERYISLYKDAGTSSEKREMIKKDIGERMDKGTLGERTIEAPAQDDESRAAKKAKVAPVAQAAKKTTSKPKEEAAKVDEGKIEDDDFFEF